ncbi:hypothetical protein L218DRAFT_1001896 [Marasmius fiardii PR-910]|nr:hypothetical protein L218DRAFT_1001896 [Marasmius fiardii PR-910]
MEIGNHVNIEGHKNTTITNYYGDNNYYQNSFTRPNGSGLSNLKAQVAFSALHDSETRYPQPNVLPGTRKEILWRLSSWCEHPSKSSRVFWVNGAAGVGKSAIAQALSEKYIQTGQLAAAFFFSRNDATRNKLDPFVATIAYQLATSKILHPHLAPLIDHMIFSTPEILHKTLEIQFQMLIADSSAQVDPRFWSQLPRLVIIDGVDECISPSSQKRLLKMIQEAIPTLPLDFLIFSRPEPHISYIFNHRSFTPIPFFLALGDFAPSVHKDIERYLQHEFDHIWEEYQLMIPYSKALWPGHSVITELLHRATGQFIYATTVIKYIRYGKLPLTPMKRLEVILQAGMVVNSTSPYPDLDQLYSQILQFCINEDGKLQQVLRLIVSPFGHYTMSEEYSPFKLKGSTGSVGYSSIWALEYFLELSQGEASALLSGLHSILDVPLSQTENVAVLHASFSEFLLDPHRAGEFYVGKKLSNLEWEHQIIACQIRMLSQLCIESQHWPTSSSHCLENVIHNVDIGSLNVWNVLRRTDIWTIIAIDDKIEAVLNAFNPHLYLNTILTCTYNSLRIIPSADNNEQDPTVPDGWNFKYINPAEGQLLHNLLECLFQHDTVEVFASYEMEDWAYRLAQLDWNNVGRCFIKQLDL